MAPGENADHYVDVTDTLDRKIEALRAHESQTAHMDDLADRMQKWGHVQAKAAGFDADRFAEGYVILNTR